MDRGISDHVMAFGRTSNIYCGSGEGISIGPKLILYDVIRVKLWVGFVMGNPWVGKSQPAPIPTHTAPVAGTGTHHTCLAMVWYETHGFVLLQPPCNLAKVAHTHQWMWRCISQGIGGGGGGGDAVGTRMRCLWCKTKPQGLGFGWQSVGGLVLCRGYPNVVGYIGFVAGGCDSVMCKGGLVVAKNAKTEPQELGFG